MIVSPFSPLFFSTGKSDGIESEYLQTFSVDDRIFLQLIGSENWNGKAEIHFEPDHRLLCQIIFQKWKMNDSTCVLFSSISLNPGVYSITVSGMGTCEWFKVTDDKRELKNTTLIQYSMKNNRQRNDVVFFIDHMQYFFDFRVPGGFKDSNWSFGVESEQFVTQTSDIVQLYGLESTQKIFTLGSNIGVPIWFGEMLNRILVCSHVYFNGEKYTRKDSNFPEITVLIEGVNSFIFNQKLQRSVNLDPVIEHNNNIIMRRTPENIFREIEGDNPRIVN